MIQKFLFLAILPVVVYVLCYAQMFLQGKSLICEGNQPLEGQCYCHQDSSFWVDWLKKIAPQKSAYWESLEARGGCKRLISHFDELHHQIWWYQTTLTATHPYQSRPWQWFLDLRPVWFYVNYQDNMIANIYSFGNPLLFWSGDVAVVFTILYIVWPQKQKEKKKPLSMALPPLLFLLVAYFSVWAFWQFSPRIMFFYHYTPAVPLLCIVLAYWLVQLARSKKVQYGKWYALGIVGLIAACFVIFYPNWTGMFVPKNFADAVYFMIPSWR